MTLIGENIHIISPKIKAAVIEKDEKFILDLVEKQVNSGIKIIDLNIGPAKAGLVDSMKWLIETIQNKFDVDFSLDTTSIEELKSGFATLKNSENAFLNSTSTAQKRLENTTNLASQYNCNLIALTLSPETGIPKVPEERLELAYEMVSVANEKGIDNSKIYLDPLVLPVCVEQAQAGVTLDSIRMFKESFDPEIKTVIGLSNISNGCRSDYRALINRVYLTLALGAGLDSAIVDGLDLETIKTYNCLKNNIKEIDDIYFELYEMSKNFGDLEEIQDKTHPAYKSAQILLNKEIYNHSYL